MTMTVMTAMRTMSRGTRNYEDDIERDDDDDDDEDGRDGPYSSGFTTANVFPFFIKGKVTKNCELRTSDGGPWRGDLLVKIRKTDAHSD